MAVCRPVCAPDTRKDECPVSPRYLDLAPSVRAVDLTDEKFKTFRISVNLVVPLEKESAAMNAVLPHMVGRVTKEFPDYSGMSRHLASLYGASLSSAVSQIGDNQVLTLAVSGISGKYAFGGEDMEQELLSLLCSGVFHPLREENGLFPHESFQQEQRQLLETIDADFNDKKTYAKDRCTQELFCDEPAGISRYGTAEQVKKLDPTVLPAQWEEILRRAVLRIYVSGNCDFNSICAKIQNELGYERDPWNLTNSKLPAKQVKEVEESMKVTQSKLVLGFKAPQVPGVELRVMSVLFGGSPSSKLFLNVREKMSLCYYCSARAGVVKGSVIVESGVETSKLQEAKSAILEQLEQIRKGNFTEEELTFAKLSMSNSYRSVEDSLYSMENYYLNQMFASSILSPQEQICAIEKVTREQVIAAAQQTELDTVYALKGC